MMEKSVFAYAVKRIKPLLLILSVVVLLRGHNEPGGGFIGGLMAGSAYILAALVSGPAVVRRTLPVSPTLIMAFGLLIALLSGLPGWIGGEPFFTGMWLSLERMWLSLEPVEGYPLKLGTPLLFDVGVFLAVIGFTLAAIFTLMEEWKWN